MSGSNDFEDPDYEDYTQSGLLPTARPQPAVIAPPVPRENSNTPAALPSASAVADTISGEAPGTSTRSVLPRAGRASAESVLAAATASQQPGESSEDTFKRWNAAADAGLMGNNHTLYANPRTQAAVNRQNIASSEQAAEQMARDFNEQAREQAREEAGRLRAQAAAWREQGMEMEHTPEGGVRPKIREDGSVVFKPSSKEPFQWRTEDGGDGQWYQDHKDDRGELHRANLVENGQYHTDAVTGERYITLTGGVRHNIGVDENVQKVHSLREEQDALALKDAQDEADLKQRKLALRPLEEQLAAARRTLKPEKAEADWQAAQAYAPGGAMADPELFDSARKAHAEFLQKWGPLQQQHDQAKADIEALEAKRVETALERAGGLADIRNFQRARWKRTGDVHSQTQPGAEEGVAGEPGSVPPTVVAATPVADVKAASQTGAIAPSEANALAASEVIPAGKKAGDADFTRGVEVSLRQIPALAHGMVALFGGTAEKVLGEGGVATDVKNWGLKGYQAGMSKTEALAKDTDDIQLAWSRAKNGDVGALVDWFQYAAGYTVGQVGETVAVSLLAGLTGAATGTAVEPGGGTLAGGAAGVVAGATAKTATKGIIFGAVEKLLARSALNIATKAAEKEGLELTAEELMKRAASAQIRKEAAKGIAQKTGIAANSLMMELGGIYPEAVKQSEKEGKELSGADIAKVWATGIGAAGFDALTDSLGLDVALGKIRLGGANRLSVAAKTGALMAAGEGVTEVAQTALERYGSNQSLTDPSAASDYINSAAMGMMGGGVLGGAGAMLHGGSERPKGSSPDNYQRLLETHTKLADALETPEGLNQFNATRQKNGEKALSREEVLGMKEALGAQLHTTAQAVIGAEPAKAGAALTALGSRFSAERVLGEISENPVLARVALVVGHEGRGLVEPSALQGARAAIGGGETPNQASRARLDQLVGTHLMLEHLGSAATTGEMEPQAGALFERLGLVRRTVAQDGTTAWHLTEDGIPFLQKGLREAIARDPSRFHVSVGHEGEPGAVARGLDEAGAAREAAAVAGSGRGMQAFDVRVKHSDDSGGDVQEHWERVHAEDAAHAQHVAGEMTTQRGRLVLESEALPMEAEGQLPGQARSQTEVGNEKGGTVTAEGAQNLFKSRIKAYAADFRKLGIVGVEGVGNEHPDVQSSAGLFLNGEKIYVNYERLARSLSAKLQPGESPHRLVDAMIHEEFLHALGVDALRAASKAENPHWSAAEARQAAYAQAEEIARTAPAPMTRAASKLYNGWRGLSDFQKGHELLRMVLSGKYRGAVTEAIYKAANRIARYLVHAFHALPPESPLRRYAATVEARARELEIDLGTRGESVKPGNEGGRDSEAPAPQFIALDEIVGKIEKPAEGGGGKEEQVQEVHLSTEKNLEGASDSTNSSQISSKPDIAPNAWSDGGWREADAGVGFQKSGKNGRATIEPWHTDVGLRWRVDVVGKNGFRLAKAFRTDHEARAWVDEKLASPEILKKGEALFPKPDHVADDAKTVSEPIPADSKRVLLLKKAIATLEAMPERNPGQEHKLEGARAELKRVQEIEGAKKDEPVLMAAPVVGMKLKEVGEDFPKDEVRSKLLDIRGTNAEIVKRAAAEFQQWPKEIRAADGSVVLLKNPENGSFGTRIKHLLFDNENNRMAPHKAEWMSAVPDTLQHAAIRLIDDQTGNRIFVRAYHDNQKHMVVVRPDGLVEEQKSFTGALITQFPDGIRSRQSHMLIDWVRPGNGKATGRFQGNPVPTPTGSTHPDARQPEFQSKPTPETQGSQGADADDGRLFTANPSTEGGEEYGADEQKRPSQSEGGGRKSPAEAAAETEGVRGASAEDQGERRGGDGSGGEHAGRRDLENKEIAVNARKADSDERERVQQSIRKTLSSLRGAGTGSVLETEARDIGRGARAIQAEQGTDRANGERQSLVQWAVQAKRVIPPARFENRKPHHGGVEHDVWFDKARDRVEKITRDKPVQITDYLERLALQNSVFGDDLRIEGVTFHQPSGRVAIVTSQPFRRGEHPTQVEIDARMSEMGFERFGTPEGLFRGRGRGITVADATPKNWIKDAESGDLMPIDLQIVAHAETRKSAGLATSPVDVAAHEAATSPRNDLETPTKPQKAAGNYKMGHLRIGGLDISVENPQGSTRSGVTKEGKPWHTTLKDHYGYIRGTEGKDGDHVDVFVKPGTPEDWSGTVFVVNQNDPESGRFDEHKAILGANSRAEADKIYHSNYQAGWKGMRNIVEMPLERFKEWVADGKKSVPAMESPTIKDSLTVQSQATDADAPTENASPNASDSSKARARAASEVSKEIKRLKNDREKGIVIDDITEPDDPSVGPYIDISHPESDSSWMVYEDNGKWRGESSTGSLTADHYSKDEAIQDVKERLLDEVNNSRGTFGADIDNSSGVGPIFEHFALPSGVTQTGWEHTKWNSWYNTLRIGDETYKVSVRDHDSFRQDMGVPSMYAEVSKNWNPLEVAKALDRIERWVHKKASAESLSESGAAGIKTSPEGAADKSGMSAKRTGSRSALTGLDNQGSPKNANSKSHAPGNGALKTAEVETEPRRQVARLEGLLRANREGRGRQKMEVGDGVASPEVEARAKKDGITSAETRMAEALGIRKPAKTPEALRADEQNAALAKELAAMEPKVARLEGVRQSVSGFKEWLKRLWDENTRLPDEDPYKRSVNRYTAKLQASEITVMDMVKHILDKVPDALVREGITNWRVAQGDVNRLRLWAELSQDPKLKAGYEAALRLTPEQKELARTIDDYYKSKLALGQERGMLEHGVENYASQIWRDDKGKKLDLDGIPSAADYARDGKGNPLKDENGNFILKLGKKFQQGFAFANARQFEDFFTGESQGFRPLTKDAASLLGIYGSEFNRTLALREFVQELTSVKAADGRPIVGVGVSQILRGVKEGEPADLESGAFHIEKPENSAGFKTVNHPVFERWKFTVPLEEAMELPGQARSQMEFGNEVLGEPAAEKAKTVAMLRSGNLTVHPDFEKRFNYLVGESGLRQWMNSKGGSMTAVPKAILRGVNWANKEVKALTFLGSPFHIVHLAKRAAGYQINPFTRLDPVDPENPLHRRALLAGLMVAPDKHGIGQWMDGLGAKHGAVLAGALESYVPVLGPASAALHRACFEYYIPRLKMKSWAALTERMVKRFRPELDSGRMSVYQVENYAARIINNAYGHLNYAELGRSPTVQHLTSLAVLAPDFTESTLRHLGDAARGLIPGGKVGRESVKSIATLALGTFFVAKVLNKLIEDEWHLDHPFSIIAGNREYSVRSQVADIQHLFHDPVSFAGARLSPLSRQIMQVLSKKNYRGETMTWTDLLRDLIATWIPSTVRALPGVNNLSPTDAVRNVKWYEQFTSTMGFKIARYNATKEINAAADKFLRSKGRPSMYGSFQPSRFRELKNALDDGDMEAARAAYQRISKETIEEAKRKAKGGATVRDPMKSVQDGFYSSVFHPIVNDHALNKEFLRSLTSHQRELYIESAKDRSQIWRRFQKISGATKLPPVPELPPSKPMAAGRQTIPGAERPMQAMARRQVAGEPSMTA